MDNHMFLSDNHMFLSEVDVLRVQDIYGVADFNRLSILEKGQSAEEELNNLVTEILEDIHIPFEIIRDLSLSSSQSVQIDLLLMTPGLIWIMEVKNYQGILELKDGELYYQNCLLERNEIEQCKVRQRILRRLFNEGVKVKASIFLMNPESEFYYDEMPDIEILTRNMVRRRLEEELHQTQFNNQMLSLSQMNKCIHKIRVEPFFPPKPLTHHQIDHLIRGVYCTKCQKNITDIRYRHFYCQACNTWITKQTAVHQAYFNLNVLFFDSCEYFTAYDIDWLMNQAVSRSCINRSMKKLLKNIDPRQRPSRYPNYGLTQSKIYQKYSDDFI